MIKTEIKDGISIISLNDITRLNALVSDPIKEQASNYLDKPKTNLVISLAGVKFIDSSGFGMLLFLMKKAKNSYGTFKICDVSPEVMELLKLLQLHTIFEIFPTLHDCMKSYPNS
jgi:anti-sigma B factor antagonist